MPFRKYVEIGRLAVVNFGPDYGLPVLISDIVDQNRVLVDHPEFHCRRLMNLKRLSLTNLKLEISRLFKKQTLKEALSKNDVFEKFKESEKGKRLAAAKEKREMTDLARWRIAKTRTERAKKIREVYNRLKAEQQL
eukprot:g5149.t1